ncbi:OpgC family protein [Rhodobacter aestuarii]|nr:OpgC domain-containing protein [Rhodobacter aestuarii]
MANAPKFSQPAGLPAGARDPRLDFFRGLSLVMIYINHIPGNFYEHFTSRNLGPSDAAEAFVFMSGCAAALAYGPKLKDGLNWPGIRKVWGRAWLLYMVHILTTVWAIAIAASATLWFGGEAMLERNAFGPLLETPLEFLVGIATLGHQLGYVNILPMYAVMLLGAPFLIRLGQRSMWGLFAFTVGFWVLTGLTRLDPPNFPYKGGWFFNPFAWQLLFSLGILTGLALRKGKRLVPVTHWLIWPVFAWLIFAFAWVHMDVLLKNVGHAMWQLRQWGVPFFLVNSDKTFVGVPRLLHFLGLAYILSLPWLVPQIAASRWTKPIRTLGKQGLQVFALGTVLAIFGQAVKVSNEAGGFAQDSVLIFGGLAIQWAFAAIREYIKPHPNRPQPVPQVGQSQAQS